MRPVYHRNRTTSASSRLKLFIEELLVALSTGGIRSQA
jgi:hypothetical protein